eukprot:SAG11_NODE_65_length_18798_cov_11.881224_6_plen_133_part_00
MQLIQAQQRAQYQTTIAALQHQLAMRTALGQDAQLDGEEVVYPPRRRAGGLHGRTADLQAQINDLRGFYGKKVRDLEDRSREGEARAAAAAAKLRMSREKWSNTRRFVSSAKPATPGVPIPIGNPEVSMRKR